MIHGAEEIPNTFQNPYFKDVSKYYYKGVNIKINFSKDNIENKRFAYLCVFDNFSWVPIHWAVIKGGDAIFKEMGRNVVYMAALFSNGKIKPIGYPIKVDSVGAISSIVPRLDKPQTVVLKRKYPIFDWWDSRTLALKGGVSNLQTISISELRLMFIKLKTHQR